MIDVVLITSCIDSSNIYNLLHSINRSNVYVKALVVVVNQTEDLIFIDSNGCNEYCFLETRKRNLGLLNSSSARNVALDYLYTRNLSFRYVCFPDDDTTYDMIFFQSLYRSISDGIDFNYIFDAVNNNVITGAEVPILPAIADIRLSNGLLLKSVADAITDGDATALPAGAVVVTSNATGLGRMFISNGSILKQLAFATP
jgi:hypothetical protein